MLTSYPILLNNVTLPFPSGWDESYDVIETVNQTEAGTDSIEVQRYDKLSVSVSTTCLSDLAETLAGLKDVDVIVLKYYDLKTKAYKERNVRMRNFTAKLSKSSHTLSVTNGVWDISFKLEEF